MAARLGKVFGTSDNKLHAFLQHMRVAALAAAAIQYDAADLAAKQLSVQVNPEPFSNRQRLQ